MITFRCPVCELWNVSWDARSNAFLCQSLRCSFSMRPPSGGRQAADGDVGRAISQGRICADTIQTWLSAGIAAPARPSDPRWPEGAD